ncbi:glycosyltransferase family 2 protein [Glaciihabitans arcticus]|uniref:Glycosyltransferase family 2 protein n=1 Tax=Glaciihabitans arcticus TaxID=2668039 RepID=A0A4Q9GUY3_9MICO|nr:glycosyltransferase [Glaciihabitans arcticus]TBN55980.1 glycosyltransferase family 2 protein [Glaciihabitans arcticus]
MQPRVTVILVARNGAQYLERTLAALAQQTRRPDSLVVVDAGSSDSSAALLTEAHPTQFVASAGRPTFGDSVIQGLKAAAPTDSNDDWLWLLGHDNAPAPRALAALLGAVEIAPSVAVAGPKLMRWDAPDTISSYGESITGLGTTVDLVSNELDQAQHDRRSDLLAVAAAGMLVRRRVWNELAGFDPALPHVDAALDFCVRVRLAGHRIVGVPAAHVASAGAPDLFGSRSDVSKSATARHARAAQLHRRLVYAPGAAVPLHWLTLLPLAITRSIAHLLTKNPAAIGGEFSAAFAALFGAGVAPARRNLRRTRTLGWGAITPLRMPAAEARELRVNRREALAVAEEGEALRPRAGFLSGGGAWITLALAAVGVVMFGPYLNATSLTGGGLLPLSATVSDLWTNVTYGWHEIAGGFTGAADPFAWVLAVLGSLTFWAPSLSVVALYLVALPLAGLAAWWCAARITERAWAPAVAAIAWALAPPFLAGLMDGRLGAVIAHLLLPWFVLALLGSTRRWSSAGAAALLFAAIVASAPILAPAMVLGWIAWAAAHTTSIPRLFAVPLPAVLLFVPLVVQQVARGNPLAILADPGVSVLSGSTVGWQLALGAPAGQLNGWAGLGALLGLPSLVAPIAVAVLLLPLAGLAGLALFLPGLRRSIPSLAVALVGFVTAVFSTHLSVAFAGSDSVTVWAGSGLSVYWLGLVGAAAVALDTLRRAAVAPALAASFALLVLAVPLLVAPLQGTTVVTKGNGRILPALVTAEAAARPTLGTLELVPQADGSLAATLHRGAGATLDDYSTLASTATDAGAARERIAVLAGNLASRSGYDSIAELDALGIGFILAPDTAPGDSTEARTVRSRAGEALDANPIFTAVGESSNGFLWRYDGAATDAERQPEQGATTPVGLAILLTQSIVLVMALLLAVPTSRRRRSTSTTDDEPDTDAEFEEDDNV